MKKQKKLERDAPLIGERLLTLRYKQRDVLRLSLAPAPGLDPAVQRAEWENPTPEQRNR